MTRMIEKCFRPISEMNSRILIGGGILGLIVIGEAAFAFAPNLV